MLGSMCYLFNDKLGSIVWRSCFHVPGPNRREMAKLNWILRVNFRFLDNTRLRPTDMNPLCFISIASDWGQEMVYCGPQVLREFAERPRSTRDQPVYSTPMCGLHFQRDGCRPCIWPGFGLTNALYVSLDDGQAQRRCWRWIVQLDECVFNRLMCFKRGCWRITRY